MRERDTFSCTLWLVLKLDTWCISLVLCGVRLYCYFVAEDYSMGFGLPKAL
jgi:hypothetical protein